MNAWLFAIIGFAVGLLAAAAFFLARRGRVQADLTTARARNDLLQDQLDRQNDELRSARSEIAEVDDRREVAERETAALREQLKAREHAYAEKEKLLEEAKTRLSDAFAATGAKTLQANTEEFLKLARATFEKLMSEAKGDVEKRQQAIDALVKPIRELLEKHGTAVSEIEKKREVAYRGLEEQIKQILASHEKLDRETGRLVTALRRPEQRGRWGEMQLRNVVELAGMSRYCDFREQVQTDDPSTRDRPDMIVHLPGEGVIVVDSKVALDAYLDSLQPDADRETLLRTHAGQVEAHYRKLSSKRYWEQFDRTPKLVVMFMPLESALVAALEIRPHLHSDAMTNHVLIATPTLLVALLRAIAYGWQQEDIAANARQISETGRELYDRLATFAGHFEKIGKGLGRATDAYNSAVGSLERMVLPSSRRLKELHATTSEDIAAPNQIEIETRRITADELLPAADETDAPRDEPGE
ncbi:MAG: DNA recombination protein RmuC [Planctomycetota bacterium]|nr:DNA recombination protein RmuC [Planctomycetota bacterium]